MSALAGERQEVFVATIAAADTGETAAQIPAVQIIPDHPREMLSPKTIANQVAVFPDAFQHLEVIFHKLEVGTLARIPLSVGMTFHAL